MREAFAVVHVVARHLRHDDFQRLCVEAEVHLFPGAAFGDAVLAHFPFAFAIPSFSCISPPATKATMDTVIIKIRGVGKFQIANKSWFLPEFESSS
jgi:hypothetical protein